MYPDFCDRDERKKKLCLKEKQPRVFKPILAIWFLHDYNLVNENRNKRNKQTNKKWGENGRCNFVRKCFPFPRKILDLIVGSSVPITVTVYKARVSPTHMLYICDYINMTMFLFSYAWCWFSGWPIPNRRRGHPKDFWMYENKLRVFFPLVLIYLYFAGLAQSLSVFLKTMCISFFSLCVPIPYLSTRNKVNAKKSEQICPPDLEVKENEMRIKWDGKWEKRRPNLK